MGREKEGELRGRRGGCGGGMQEKLRERGKGDKGERGGGLEETQHKNSRRKKRGR